MSDYDVIVVGAGYGGVTAAALLVREGMRVLLVDKNDRPGGKAMTMRRGGFGYELWPIAGGPAAPSRFHQLVALLGLEADVELLVPDDGGEFRYRGDDGVWRVAAFSARPGSDVEAGLRAARDLGATEHDLAGFATMLAAVFSATDDDLAALDEVDALRWVRSFGIGRPLESQHLTVLNLLFVVPVDRLPASEAIRTLRDFYVGGAGRYHADGYARPAEALVRWIAANGGTYLLHTRVRRVAVDHGHIVGIETSAGGHRAPVVISNAGIQPTVLKLVGPACFPLDYVERVRAFEPSWSFVGRRYVVDAPVFDARMVLQFTDESWWDQARFDRAACGDWPEEPLLFVTVPALYDRSLAPDDGSQMALAGTMCSPDPTSPMNEEAVRRVDDAMRRRWPALADHLVRAETFTAANVAAASRDVVLPGQGGECIGLAQVIGQCGRTKPDIRSPVEGLYFVGCDAGGYGCGTHQAVESGFVVAEAVARDRALV